MTSLGDGHLSDKQLVLYADGELGSRETTRVRDHLQACWTCRARAGDLEKAIKDLVDFRSQVLLPLVPPPPGPWKGLEPKFRQLDSTETKNSLFSSISWIFRFIHFAPQHLVFGLLVLAGLIVLLCLPSERLITANELLARVQAAQTAELGKVPAPVLHQRLRVRRNITGSAERSIADFDTWEDQSRGRFRQTGSSEEVLAELRTVCKTNQLNWQSPLSASGYARWRDSLAAKRDTVAVAGGTLAGGPDASGERLALTTTARGENADSPPHVEAGANRIIQAELVVRTVDWHPVEERLWVAGREYEIAELDYRVLPLSEVDAGIFAEAAPVVEPIMSPRHPTIEAVAPPPPRPDPEDTEMAVRYELHQLDADLGEPVDIRQESNGEVHIDASEASPHLQSLLKDKFSSLPDTELQLERAAPVDCPTCPDSGTVEEEKPSAALTVPPTVNPNEKRLEEIFGEPRAQESFTREVLNLSGEALSHCFALRNLALRYPPQVEADLKPSAQKELRQMVDDHFTALTEGFSHLQGLLRPLLEALSGSGQAEAEPGVTEAGPEVAGPKVAESNPYSVPTWQDRSTQILTTMQRADLLVRSLLTSTNNPLPANRIIPPLRQALNDQQRALKQYQGHAVKGIDSTDQ